MGKVKDKKRANKKSVLKEQRKAREGSTDGALRSANERLHEKVARLTTENETLREIKIAARDDMQEIVRITADSRWKEAKGAGAVAQNFLDGLPS